MSDKINRDTLTKDTQQVFAKFLVEAKKAGVNVLTEAEREASRVKALSQLSPNEPFWLFAYGSLMWNPVVKTCAEKPASLIGWHRAFCIDQPMSRGSIDNPGLMMGLAPGGSCQAKVYRIAKQDIESESYLLWKREQSTDIYLPQWLQVDTIDGPIKALAFVVDAAHPRIRLDLSLQVQGDIIAQAKGIMGSNDEYLFNTMAELKKLNIVDADLEALTQQVLLRASRK